MIAKVTFLISILLLTATTANSQEIIENYFKSEFIEVSQGIFMKKDEIKIRSGKIIFKDKGRVIVKRINPPDPTNTTRSKLISFKMHVRILQAADSLPLSNINRWDIFSVSQIIEKKDSTTYTTSDFSYKNKVLGYEFSKYKAYRLFDDINNREYFLFPFLKRMIVGEIELKYCGFGGKKNIVTNRERLMDSPVFCFMINGNYYTIGTYLSVGDDKESYKFYW